MKINCIIVEDEPIARKGLQSFAERIPFLAVSHAVADAKTAKGLISSEKVDLMILDINMPGINGLELLRQLHHPPVTIITTAYPGHALEGFELDVIDYIVKPVSFNRFTKAVHKAKEFLEARNTMHAKEGDYFFIKEGARIEKINTGDILYIESLQNYSAIYTLTRKYLALLSLKALEEHLPSALFMKVHKSFIVNMRHIASIEGDDIVIGTHRVPISRSNKETVINAIVGSKLLRRKG
jgi:DNA-binding LytR/AlgR family response regulator